MNVIFYHMYYTDDSFDRFDRTMEKIKESGLYDKVDHINLNIVNLDGKTPNRPIDPNVKVTFGEHKSDESDTLIRLWKHCQVFNGNVLYLHSKGVTRGDNKNIRDWVDLMEHFCINKYESCLQTLETHDTCGVNLSLTPMLHYSGNFWWATNKYIKQRNCFDHTLSSNIKDKRWYCEFWLLDQRGVNPASLHQSGIDHYANRYPKDKYTT